MYQLSVLVLGACALSVYMVYAQTLSPSNIIRCRRCSRARTLGDCNKLTLCDSTLEECYMDELITDTLTVVYEGGCRAKDVCARGVGKRKREDLVSCSGCCNFEDDCNKRLCNIRDDSINSTQCYSCDHRSSEQGEVKDPRQCVTLDVCLPNEMCYAQQSDIGGIPTFFYGCKSRLQCRLLMRNAYETHRVCDMHDTTLLEPGVTREQYCLIKRAANLCHACCADGGCNYGTCSEILERMFRLADAGKFSFDTLKLIP